MSQSDNRVMASANGSRLIRRLILAFVIALVVGGLCFVRSQLMNRVTLVNESSERRMVRQVFVAPYFDSISHSSGKWLGRTSLIEDHMLPPRARLTVTFTGHRFSHLVVVKEGKMKQDPMRTLRMAASWGFRWTIGWDTKSEEIWDGEPTTLRRWFDSTRSWLPLPASWRE